MSFLRLLPKAGLRTERGAWCRQLPWKFERSHTPRSAVWRFCQGLFLSKGSGVGGLRRVVGSTLQRFNASTFLAALFFTAVAPAEPFITSPEASVTSVSGQFVATAATGYSPLLHHPVVAGDAEFIRLEPTFLAVSAERLKISLTRMLRGHPGEPWSGKIYLALHPAESLAEEPVLVAQPFLGKWNCRVELPDVTSRARLIRALTAALLLESANRRLADLGKPAEIPSWLADGLAQEILADEGDRVILAAPSKLVDNVPQTRTDRVERGHNVLAGAHTALLNADALTFEQLSWPTGAQVSGADGGAYRASAQLLVHSLLALKDGPEKMRRFIAELSRVENWQTAFLKTFSENFQRPLDVEKWWTLRVVGFAARNPGPRWTPAASRDRLAETLAVPVDIRSGSNALPQHMEISLQTAIRSFDAKQRASVLPVKLRDLELAQFRLAPEFAALANGYREALAEFLGVQNSPPPGFVAKKSVVRGRAGKTETIKKLDALDIRRRELEIKVREQEFRARLIQRSVSGQLDRK